jgi:eukaryotic-like serine/threonine-protein kinase
MSTPHQTGYESLPPAAAGRVDEACDRFETAWRDGPPPAIERFLDHVPGPEQTVLVRELILVDAPFRRRAGDEPCTEDYQARFPDLDATWLANVLAPSGASPTGLIAPTSLADPPTIPGYQLLGEIGRGGMGIVYKARQVKLNRIVAVKMILNGPGSSPGEVARFQAEAEAVARLQHPNIVQVHEIGMADGRAYLAMEYVDGGNLAQATRGTTIDPRAAATLVRTLADAAQHAHERGIVHRDLKPANILLSGITSQKTGVSKNRSRTPDPYLLNPKIADFGLVKRLEADATLTGTGAILGTPSYMAPEQTTGSGKDVGPPADVYALGVVLYELLTGRPPFHSQSPLETLEQVRNSTPIPPRALKPGVPPDLDTICVKCLQKEPGRRYRSAAALADDLDRFLDGEPINARPVGHVERAALWSRRHPALAAVIVLVLLAVAVGFPGVTWLWYRAETALERERVALGQEKQARLETDIELNAKRLALAHNAWLGGDLATARAYLKETGEPYRTEEWHSLWTACTAERVVFREHEAIITRVAVSHDGRLVASTDTLGVVHIWELESGRIVHTIRTASKDGSALAFDASGRLVYSTIVRRPEASNRPEILVRILDPMTGTEVRSFRRPAAPRAEFSPDGRRLLQIGLPTTVTNVETGMDEAMLANGPNFLLAAWARDGRHLALIMANRTTVAAGDVEAVGVKLRSFSLPDDQSLRGQAIAVGPAGDRIAYIRQETGEPRQRLYVRGLGDGRLETTFLVPHSDPVYGLEFSSDGTRLATACQDRTAVVLDAATGRKIIALRGHGQGLFRLTFSPDGRRLISASSDQTVRVWSLP